jgi:hypothetical protein
MKCLNLYAVYGEDPKKGSLDHLPVFEDADKKQYINVNGKFVPLAAKKFFIRTEPAALGN